MNIETEELEQKWLDRIAEKNNQIRKLNQELDALYSKLGKLNSVIKKRFLETLTKEQIAIFIAYCENDCMIKPFFSDNQIDCKCLQCQNPDEHKELVLKYRKFAEVN